MRAYTFDRKAEFKDWMMRMGGIQFHVSKFSTVVTLISWLDYGVVQCYSKVRLPVKY